MSSLPKLDPQRMSSAVMFNILSEQKNWEDKPVLSLYNIGRYDTGFNHWGNVYSNDVTGCNFRCAHCWVHPAALAANTESEFIKKKFEALPKQFKGQAVLDADDVFTYLEKRMKGKEWKSICFTGGETTLYRGGLKRVAELAQQNGVFMGIDTNGWLIAEHEDYLDAWEGLQDTMNFYVSIKGPDPKEFRKFTGVDEEHWEAPYIAVERLLRRGFHTVPGGVMTNFFAHGYDLTKKPNPITQLYDRLEQIDKEVPSLVGYYKYSTLVHDKAAQKRSLLSRGYESTKPSEFQNALETYFTSRGQAPIRINADRNVPLMLTKKPTIERIIKRLQKKSTSRQLAPVRSAVSAQQVGG